MSAQLHLLFSFLDPLIFNVGITKSQENHEETQTCCSCKLHHSFLFTVFPFSHLPGVLLYLNNKYFQTRTIPPFSLKPPPQYYVSRPDNNVSLCVARRLNHHVSDTRYYFPYFFLLLLCFCFGCFFLFSTMNLKEDDESGGEMRFCGLNAAVMI